MPHNPFKVTHASLKLVKDAFRIKGTLSAFDLASYIAEHGSQLYNCSGNAAIELVCKWRRGQNINDLPLDCYKQVRKLMNMHETSETDD